MAKPKPASSDPQAKAERLLRMSKDYLANGMTALAKKNFQEIRLRSIPIEPAREFAI